MRNKQRKYDVQMQEKEAQDKLAKRREDIVHSIKSSYNERK